MELASCATAVLSGVVFGFALDKGKVSVPYAISKQMEMGNFSMMRMFLAATATATLSMSALHNLGYYERKPKQGKKLGFGLMAGFGANVLGGILLGAGMYLAGACPGTVWAQTGAMHSLQQVCIVLGGLCGSLAFGYSHKWITKVLPDYQVPTEVPLASEPHKVNVVGVITAVSIYGGIAMLNNYFPWKEQLREVLGSYNAEQVFGDRSPDPIGSVAWDPLLAGIVVGLLQFPAVLSMGNSFGSSGGWVYFANRIANIFDSDLQHTSPYLYNAQSSVVARWQALLAIGAIGGGFASTWVSPGVSCTELTVEPLRAFIGGFCLLVGSRLGGGCTSGHGLSGIATGSLASVVSVCSMFGGGIIAALMVNPTGFLTNLNLK